MSISELTAEIVERIAPFEAAIDLMCQIPGWGRTTAEVFIAETGGDMAVFPTAGQLASWAGVTPGTYESAGKRRPIKAVQGNRWLGRVLIEAARGSQEGRNIPLGPVSSGGLPSRTQQGHRGCCSHHVGLRLAHATTGEPYRELGSDYFFQRRDPERQARRLTRRLEQLGYNVTIAPAA
jgi:hypothetical protein